MNFHPITVLLTDEDMKRLDELVKDQSVSLKLINSKALLSRLQKSDWTLHSLIGGMMLHKALQERLNRREGNE